MQTVVVVGASLAGVRAAETLRTSGFDGRIVMVGNEPHMPYDRPPLSKKFLSGEWDADRVVLRKPEMLTELNLEWMLGADATALNTARRTVTVGNETLAYDGLIIATGGLARRLPNQPDLKGIHVLRTLDDATSLRAELRGNVVVIGAGFIGLEAAATASAAGCTVTVLEGFQAPLMRGLGVAMGSAVGDVHRRHGVDLRCGVRVDGFEGDTRVTGVRLADGDVVPADVVIVGIGVTPAIDWLADSGLTLRDGVVCDEFLCAGPDTVFAAGDVARWPNALFADIEPDMRVEHWTTAAEEGQAAATNLLARLRGDEPQAFVTVPFFWSDQFEARVQFLGRATAASTVDVVAGDPATGKWCAMYSENGRLTGVLGVSMPKLVMPARALLQKTTTRDEALAHFAAATGA
ncbi:MAG: NAD(P)/FAD-dependent oxidoreductase [Ilumatobacteraceae bacterium]